jgi:hypothetical protein
VGTTPGGADVVAPPADPATGRRRLARRGWANGDAGWVLDFAGTGVPPELYWSVQAVDAALAGSAFSAEEHVNSVSGVQEQELPTVLALHGGVPNPFNATTTITFDLPRPSPVRVAIYDLGGRRLRVLVDGLWDVTDGTGRAAASGVYVCELKAGSRKERRTITLVK